MSGLDPHGKYVRHSPQPIPANPMRHYAAIKAARQRRRTAPVAPPPEPNPGERAYVCSARHCGRFTYLSWDDSLDWLIAYRVRSRTRKGRGGRVHVIGTDRKRIIVRCPQHITQWALREAGAKTNKEAMALIRRNKARDERNAIFRIHDPHLEPFTTDARRAAPAASVRSRAKRVSPVSDGETTSDGPHPRQNRDRT